MVPLPTARKRILGFFAGHPTAVGGLTLRVADSADMDRTSKAVRDLLRERHHLAATSPDDFILRDLAAAQRAQAHLAFLMTLMLAGAAGISLLVGGIGIMNVMLVSISERRQEIGLRMAVGARRSEIALQFLIEAGLLALLGCTTGVILSVGGAIALGMGSALSNPMTTGAAVAAVGAATLITVISALYPARKAARLDPAEALAQDAGGQQDPVKPSMAARLSDAPAALVAHTQEIVVLEADHTDKSLDETESSSRRKHQKSLLEDHGAWLLALVADRSDLSLRDIQMLLSREKVISVSVGSIWRFYDRHRIRFGKKPARQRTGLSTHGPTKSLV